MKKPLSAIILATSIIGCSEKTPITIPEQTYAIKFENKEAYNKTISIINEFETKYRRLTPVQYLFIIEAIDQNKEDPVTHKEINEYINSKDRYNEKRTWIENILTNNETETVYEVTRDAVIFDTESDKKKFETLIDKLIIVDKKDDIYENKKFNSNRKTTIDYQEFKDIYIEIMTQKFRAEKKDNKWYFPAKLITEIGKFVEEIEKTND